MRVCGNRPAGPARRILAWLIALGVLALAPACDRQPSGATVSRETGASSQAEAVNPHAIAGRLIKRTIADPEDGHVAVEIDHELLRELTSTPNGISVSVAFRDPLLAAWLFAPHIGAPADAMISIEQVSPEAEEASGLFIAVASVNAAGGSMQMRLVSEPGADGRPTLWVLNDYDR